MKPLTFATILLVWLVSAACGSPTAPPATLPPGQPTATELIFDGGTMVVTTSPATAGSATAGSATATLAPTVGPTALPAATSTATIAPTATITPTATADAAIAGGLVGMWQGNNNSFYLFNKDGTWSWDTDGQKILTNPENQGRWWIEGDVIHIQDLSGLAPCPKNQIGAYQAVLSGDTLDMAAVNDPCRDRIGQTSGTYTRQAAGP